jgi:hypothetical protein
MTHDETKAEIEAEIAEERSALARSIDQLAEQFSPETLMTSVGDTLKSSSDQIAHVAVRGAKENPAALALIGAGVAWLLLSRSGSDESGRSGSTVTRTRAAPPAAYDRRPTEPVTGFGNGASPYASDDFKARVAAAEASLQQPHEADRPSRFDRARDSVRRSASDMRARLYDGTSELSDLARTRVVEARRKALIAQERVEHHARKARGKGAGFYQENPLLVAGAVAALGAAAAMALPRTRFENETFGAHRDALVEEAERVAREEYGRAKAMAYAAMDEARDIAKETVDSVPSGEEAVSHVEAEARAAGERIADRAREAGDLKKH